MKLKKLLLLLLFPLGMMHVAKAQVVLSVSLSMTPACNYDGTVTAVVTGGTGPYTYYWNFNTLQNLTTTTPTLTGVAGGNVSLSVSAAGGGWGYGTIYVTPPFTESATVVNETCGQSNGTITMNVVGGTSPYSYIWSNGGTTQTITGISSGTYDCSITDALGCGYMVSAIDSGGIIVYNTSPISTTFTTVPTSCITGSATIIPTGGTAPYTYTWNTVPIQTTATITNVASDLYTVTVMDAVGCLRVRQLFIPSTGPAFTVAESNVDEMCSNGAGTATMSPAGGTAPYTYAWDNGGTTQTITGLSAGWYTCTITDANSCPVERHVSIANGSQISTSVAVTQPTCGMSNGVLSANTAGGTPPYTYSWTNGATTQTITGLAVGGYGVTVTDANGCVAHYWGYIQYPSSCYAHVTGTVYHDGNGDCAVNGFDGGIAYIPLQLNGGSWVMTNYQGNYAANVAVGTHSITETTPNLHTQVCPAGAITVTAPVQGTYSGNHFYNEPVGSVPDLRVNMYVGALRPFGDHFVHYQYQNVGNQPLPATITFTHDAAVTPMQPYQLISNNSNATYTYDATTRTFTYTLGNLGINEMGNIAWLYSSNGFAVGTPFQHVLTINPVAGDANPADNTITYNGVITASYDPNDKQVWPTGVLDNTVDSVLHYTVNFQNTGTDTAFTVVVRDTLESGLDPASFKMGVTSHPCVVNMSGNCVLEFVFDNINLPDSNVNEQLSHGYLTFDINPHWPIAEQTQVHNSAAIYFDYNAPVITNTATSIYGPLMSVEDETLQAFQVGLVPNPAAESVTIVYEGQAGASSVIRILDLAGRVMYESGEIEYTTQIEHALSVPSIGLTQGVYLVQVTNGTDRVTQRLVIQK